MAEWLRPGLWEVLTIKLRGIEPGQILAHKKSIGWADGTEVTSRRYYGWHRPYFFKFFISLDKILIRMEMSHLAVFPSFSSISLLPVEEEEEKRNLSNLSYRL